MPLILMVVLLPCYNSENKQITRYQFDSMLEAPVKPLILCCLMNGCDLIKKLNKKTKKNIKYLRDNFKYPECQCNKVI